MLIRITSKLDGFRRCGIAHPKVATDHPAERFTEAELERLRADPVLTVEVIDGQGKPGGGEASAAPGAAAAKPEPVAAKPVKAAAAKVTKAASGAKSAAKPTVEKTEPASQEPAGTQEHASGEGQ